MAKRKPHSQNRNKTKTRRSPSPPRQVQRPHDQEAVDGILVQIAKTDLTIVGEHPSPVQERSAYEIKVTIPDWDKNRSLLDSIRKGHVAQQKLLTKLQNEGARRPWMNQRFNEVDKTIAAVLTTVAERIRTRRWREGKRGEALPRLQSTFRHLERWAAKTARYCGVAETCTDPVEKETVLDAASLGLLKIGEFISQVERMQQGFWKDFSAAHFLDMRHQRNLIGHTDDLEAKDVIRLGMGVVKDLQAAIRRTVFPADAGTPSVGFLIPTSVVRELKPSRPGEKPAPDNSIAMVQLDDHGRFVIVRVGRSEENRALLSSSVTGTMKLNVFALESHPTMEPPGSD